MSTVEVDQHILLMAFRYALPRNTSAPSLVVRELQRHWDDLLPWMREQILYDVKRQKRLGSTYGSYSSDWEVVRTGGREVTAIPMEKAVQLWRLCEEYVASMDKHKDGTERVLAEDGLLWSICAIVRSGELEDFEGGEEDEP